MLIFPRAHLSRTRSYLTEVERFDGCLDIIEEAEQMLLLIEGHEKMLLISLEESIEPLINILPDIRRTAFVAKENSENPADGL